MLRFAAYGRVSTDEQGSIEAQIATLAPMALGLGGTITMTETEILSGLDNHRPGYARILAAARRHEIDGVLVYKFDRFGRDHVESIRAVAELELLGVQVHSATEPTSDPFVRDLILLLANRETRVMADRIKLMHRAKASQGQWQSRPPTGYVIKTTGEPPATFKTLEIDESKSMLIRRLFELAATGDYSVRELFDQARAMGLTSSSGAALTKPHIHKLLTNPAYAGDVIYGRAANSKFEARHRRDAGSWTVVRDAHPAIVDRETFDAVQAAFAQHKRVQGDIRKTGWLLTSLIFCGHCGSRMYGGSHGTKTKSGRENYSYRCARGQDYGDCEQRVVGGLTIDESVKASLRHLSVSAEVRGAALAAVEETERLRQADAQAQRRNLVSDRQRHEDKRLDLVAQALGHKSPKIAPDLYLRYEEREVSAIRIIDQTLASLDEVKPLDITAELEYLSAVNWDEFDAEAWREAVVYFVERVTVKKGTIKGKPRVDVGWTDAARFIRELVAAAV